MSELTPWLITACALALAAFLAIGWHGEREWSRVQSLHLNCLWSERERKYAPLAADQMSGRERLGRAGQGLGYSGSSAPQFPQAQAVALAPDRDAEARALEDSARRIRPVVVDGDRVDLMAAIAAAQSEPPPLDGARTLVRSDIITDRKTVGMTLPRWDEGLKRG